MKIEGEFLPALVGLIPFLTGTVLSALGVGALSGLASTGVQILNGNGLYLMKGRGVCRIEIDEEGLYLGPTSGKGVETVETDLYMMKQGGLYDGRGLILVPNSPFKNIPVLGFVILLSEQNCIYNKKMKIDETDGNVGHLYISS